MSENLSKCAISYEDNRNYYQSSFLTEREAAVYLRANQRSLAKWRNAGLIKAIKVSRSWIYRKEDLERFFNEYAGKDLSSDHYLNLKKG